MIKATPQTDNTEQKNSNLSFDSDFNINAVELVGYDSVNNVLRRIQVDSSGSILSNVTGIVGGITYDYIALGYTGSDLTTVDYKTGGSGGIIVASLVLSYSNHILQSVARTV